MDEPDPVTHRHRPEGRAGAGRAGAGPVRGGAGAVRPAPTVLEAVGLPEPKTVDGIAQEPMDGISFLATFADADAEERHTVQYFEMFGSRAM